jgi:hypothetical protein
MNTEDAIELLEKKAIANKDNFGNLDSFFTHSHNSGEIAREVAARLGLDPDEAFLTGQFHDIGRCFAKDAKGHTFHEIIGARYIERYGVELGIAGSQEQCDRIAQSIRPHFLVYEQFGMVEYSQWLPGLRDTNPELLLPRQLNEIIVVYADLTNANGKRVDFEERLRGIKDGDKRTNSPRLKVVEKAESRLFNLQKELEDALQKGKR